MLTEQRYEIILRVVNEKKSITTTELRDILDTSESTVRRDILALHRAGKLTKVFGGAIAKEQGVSGQEYTVAQKLEVAMEEKYRVAKYAAALVEPDDFVFLDAGTTTGAMVDCLTENSATYLTNAVVHAQRLAARGFKVVLLGGELKGTTEAVVGNIAVQTVQSFHFTKGFFGTNGIGRKTGFTTPDMNEACVKRAAMTNCKERFVLADESKFHSISPVTFFDFENAEIITDSMPKGYENCDNITVIE